MDTYFSRKGIKICTVQFPDRKKPALLIQKEDNCGIVVAYFRDKDAAEYFEKSFRAMMEGLIEE